MSVPAAPARDAARRAGAAPRTVTAGVPARVDYELTALGREFLRLQRDVKRWADEHAGAIAAARARYDTPATGLAAGS